MSWATLAILAVVPAAIGSAADKIMHDREKNRIHDFLLRVWNRVDDTAVPCLPQLMAKCTLAATRFVFGPRLWSPRAVGLGIALSFTLSSLAMAVGLTDNIMPPTLLEIRLSDVVRRGLPELLRILDIQIASMLLTNLLFDVLTCLVTLHILRTVERARPHIVIIVVVLDCFLAFVFAIGCVCVPSLLLLGHVARLEEIQHLAGIYVKLLTLHPLSGDGYFAVVILYGATTLIPTLAYTVLLIGLTIAKPVISAVRWAAMYILEASVDAKSGTVFTVLGCLFTMFAAIAKAIHMLSC